MLFSRNIYKIGSRCPFVFGRTETQTEAGVRQLFYTGLFANATDIVQLPKLSPFHAIMTRPSAHENIFNFVNEIPLKTKNVSTVLDLTAEHNPFIVGKQDAVMADPIPFNYGILPRTYSSSASVDPSFAHHVTHVTGKAKSPQTLGDGGALDVVELSASPLATGMATQTRILGALALTYTLGKNQVVDWKVIAANVDDDRFATVQDVPAGQLSEIKEWLLNFDKAAKGTTTPKKALAFGGRVFDEAAAIAVVEAHRNAYDSLRANNKPSAGSLWIPDEKSNPLFQLNH